MSDSSDAAGAADASEGFSSLLSCDSSNDISFDLSGVLFSAALPQPQSSRQSNVSREARLFIKVVFFTEINLFEDFCPYFVLYLRYLFCRCLFKRGVAEDDVLDRFIRRLFIVVFAYRIVYELFDIGNALLLRSCPVGIYFGADDHQIAFCHGGNDDLVDVFGHCGESVFDFLGIDVFAVCEDDHVLDSSGYEEEAVMTDATHVAGVEPAVDYDLLGCFGVFVVAQHLRWDP